MVIGIHSTVSQTTSFFNEERPITYGKLNELYKYVKYRQVADELLALDSIQIAQLNQVIFHKDQKEQLLTREIDLLNLRIQNKDSQVENKNLAISALEDSLKQANKEKWKWGIWSAIGGAVIGSFIALTF